ncbi:hypothetical protein [Haemophilus parahaemolyticus]
MKTVLELKEGWRIIKELIETSEDKDVLFYKPKELKDLAERLDSLFIETIINKLNENDREKIYSELLNVRNIFSKRAFFASRDISQLGEDDIDGIIDLLSSINEIFSKIENVEALINSYLASKAIFQEMEDKFRGQAKELFGVLTTVSIYKPYFDEYKKLKFWLVVKNAAFFGMLSVIFLVIACLSGIFTCCLDFISISPNYGIYGLISRMAILLPLVWSVLFLGKRIHEDKKIEQTYLHKMVVARSLSNYLDYMDKKLNNDENAKEITKKLFEISLDSLGLNPALLLDKSTAEKIPMEELLSKIIDKTKSS